MKISSTTIFCEDIRNEVRGTESLIGIIPDNVFAEISTSNDQPAIPKMCTYTRINLFDEYRPKELQIVFIDPNGVEMGGSIIDDDTIEAAYAGAKNLPMCGLKTQSVINNFPIIPGVFRIVVRDAEGEHLSGAINVSVKIIDAESNKN